MGMPEGSKNDEGIPFSKEELEKLCRRVAKKFDVFDLVEVRLRQPLDLVPWVPLRLMLYMQDGQFPVAKPGQSLIELAQRADR